MDYLEICNSCLTVKTATLLDPTVLLNIAIYISCFWCSSLWSCYSLLRCPVSKCTLKREHLNTFEWTPPLTCCSCVIYLSGLSFLHAGCGVSVAPDGHSRPGRHIRRGLWSERRRTVYAEKCWGILCKPCPVHRHMGKYNWSFVYLFAQGGRLLCFSNVLTRPLRQILLLLCQAGVRRREGAVDSGSLFVFWLLLVVCDIFPFQTLLREALKLVRAEMKLEQGLECTFPLQP